MVRPPLAARRKRRARTAKRRRKRGRLKSRRAKPGDEDIPIDPETGKPYSRKKWKKIQKGGYKAKDKKDKPKWGEAGSGKKKKAATKKEKVPEFVNKTPKGDKKDLSEPMLPGYQPKAVECAWGDWWEKAGHYVGDAEADKAQPHGNKFVMMLPPPNVTGSLHLGHALTVAIEDSVLAPHVRPAHAGCQGRTTPASRRRAWSRRSC